jgi:membrane dipeptidase
MHDKHARGRELLAEYGVADLHADTLLWTRLVGYDMTRPHRNRLPRAPYGWHTDLPRWKAAGLRAQLFGVVTLPVLGERGCAAAALETAGDLARVAARVPDLLSFVRSRADLESALSGEKIAAILALEGAHALEGKLQHLETLYAAGLRAVGMAHFSSNSAAPCAYGVRASRELPLSDFGRQVVEFCDASGVIVDVAHTGRNAFLESCRGARRPRIVSHTGLAGAFPHWRNIDDEQVRAVADTGGVVGIIFVPRFLGKDGAAQVAAHVNYGINLAGEDAIALGSDFDGFVVPPSDLRGAEDYPRLAEALLDAGISRPVAGKVLCENALRVLRAVLP